MHATGTWFVQKSCVYAFIAVMFVAAAASERRTLSLEERVAAERAIEEVYWRHRIWPADNPGTKPAFEATITPEQLRARVERYLKLSKALETLWARPVSGGQLQAELDRIASSTRSKDTLRELFAALGKDSSLIAETLVRQTLVERLAREAFAQDERIHGVLRKQAAAAVARCQGKPVSCLSAAGGEYHETRWALRSAASANVAKHPRARRDGGPDRIEVDGEEWPALMQQLAERVALRDPEHARAGVRGSLSESSEGFEVAEVLAAKQGEISLATVTWPKADFQEWWHSRKAEFGSDASVPATVYALPLIKMGGLQEFWSPVSTVDEPLWRQYHTAIWTGVEMIVWGGDISGLGRTSTGGRYNPATNSWIATSTVGPVPSPRTFHTAVWTGTEMIVWGGSTEFCQFEPALNDGAGYNPVTDSWASTSSGPATPTERCQHTAVWTGSKMVIWGGVDPFWNAQLDTGGQYDPQKGIWTSTSTEGVPIGDRWEYTAVWTGSEMIVWGGNQVLHTGGRYSPQTDSWLPISITGAVPDPRWRHSAVWTGSEMIVWGGETQTSTSGTGARYNPTTDTWTPTTLVDAPLARAHHTVVWTGNEMIVWGGFGQAVGNSGGRYRPFSNSWSGVTQLDAPAANGAFNNTAVWTGSEMIVWGGNWPTFPRVGGRYYPGPLTVDCSSVVPGNPLIVATTPDRGGNSGDVTLTIGGCGLDPAATVRLTGDGMTPIVAVSVSGSPTRDRLLATFDLQGAPLGLRDIVVTNPSQLSATQPDAFTIEAPSAGGFFSRTRGAGLSPRPVRGGRDFLELLEYGNNGNVDVPAPVLVIEGTGGADLRVSPLEPYTDDPVQFLALGPEGAVDTLPPGSRFTLPIYFRSPGGNTAFSILVSLMPADEEPIDWVAMEQQLRPDDIANDAWAAIWGTVQSRVGDTRAEYRDVLAADAVYLGNYGRRVHAIRDLFNFEMVQAKGLVAPTRTLEEATDLAIDAPGLPLVFSRNYPLSVEERFRLGPLGRGWSHNWQMSLAQPRPGEVEVRGPGERRRLFVPLFTDLYVSNVGDPGVLSRRPDLGWKLKEKDGRTWAFSASGVLESLTDINSNQLSFTYDSGNLVHIEHSNGFYIDLDYSTDNRLVALVDHAGRQVQYDYDGSGEHLDSVTLFGGRETLYAYTAPTGASTDHALTTITHPDATQRELVYDTRGRLTAESWGNDLERVEYEYVDPGEVRFGTPGSAPSTLRVGYDAETLETIDPLGNRRRYAYGADSGLQKVNAPSGTQTRYAYDSKLNVREATDALGNTVTFGWTSVGTLAWMRDQLGHITHYVSDERGNTTAIDYPDQSLPSRTATYDADGNVTSTKNRRNQTITYDYDVDGRLSQKTYPGGRTITYSYDSHGNLLSAADTATGAISMQYDGRDFLTRIDYPGARWFTFAYDDAGKRTQRTGHDGYVVNYEYDAAGRLERIADGTLATIVDYDYDPAGRLSRENKGNGASTTYTYDASDRLTAIVHRNPADAVQASFTYAYDPNGRRTSVTATSGQTTYTYDDAGRLTGVSFPGGRDVAYAYDQAGNRTSVVDDGTTTTYTTNVMNQYLHVGTTPYAFDLDGNTIAKTDGSGTTTYEYDEESRLTRVLTPTAEEFLYTYDALGNRTAVSRDGVVKMYVHDPAGLVDVAAEYDGGGSLAARYIHGSGLIAQENPLGNRSHYGYDAIGNTCLITDDAGQAANTYEYEPFGALLSSNETTPNRYRFVGREGVRDEENGLDFMRARMYDPAIGRFVSEDPIGIDGGTNLYSYVQNDPVSSIDPSGQAEDCDGYEGRYEKRACKCRNFCSVDGVASKHACLACCNQGRSPIECKDEKPRRDARNPNADAICLVAASARDPRSTTGASCPQQPHSDFFVPASSDPNEKVGPLGYGPSRFFTGQEDIPYVIFFENLESATAPAAEIVVTDELDPDLDFSTVSLQEVAFGFQMVDGLIGAASGTATVPLNDTSLLVEITVTNQGDGMIEWRLKTIDPLTGDLPEDPLVGILPPNDAMGRGEGHVAFTVRPHAGVPTGTALTNGATIVFDLNPPIVTNTWLNTVDNGAPASAVTAVVPIAGGAQNTYQAFWTGVDDAAGAGVLDYTIYVSDNGAAAYAWQSNTTATSATFHAACGRTYTFYSAARDNVGNVEVAPGTPDRTLVPGSDMDGDAACDLSDNCPTVFNPSQDDSNGNGAGDACDANPAFSVSSDPADGADYGTIQAAVDAATQSGTVIEILAGVGYNESVVVDETKSFVFVGDTSGSEVIVHGVGGPAFDVLSAAGSNPVEFRGITLEGQAGIRSAVNLRLADLTFRSITGIALDLISGTHQADRLTFGPTVTDGVRVASGASLTLRRGLWQAVNGTGIQANGAMHMVNVRMSGGGTAVAIGSGGLLDARFVTIADNLVGVQNSLSGVVTIDQSIVFGNSGGDLLGVACTSLSLSDTGSAGCAGQNGNISAVPAFSSGYHLAVGSPCLDTGATPATYSGVPPVDLDGDLRLRDWNGDGLSYADMGAYEATNPALTPLEVGNLTWVSDVSMQWDAVAGATDYHVYRGNLRGTAPVLSYGYFGTCRDDLDGNRADTNLSVPADPAVGDGWFFLITARDGAAVDPELMEGSLGFGRSAERSNHVACSP